MTGWQSGWPVGLKRKNRFSSISLQYFPKVYGNHSGDFLSKCLGPKHLAGIAIILTIFPARLHLRAGVANDFVNNITRGIGLLIASR